MVTGLRALLALVLAGLVLGPLGAEAGVEQRVTALEAQVAALQGQVAALQSLVATLQTTLQYVTVESGPINMTKMRCASPRIGAARTT